MSGSPNLDPVVPLRDALAKRIIRSEARLDARGHEPFFGAATGNVLRAAGVRMGVWGSAPACLGSVQPLRFVDHRGGEIGQCSAGYRHPSCNFILVFAFPSRVFTCANGLAYKRLHQRRIMLQKTQ